MKRQTGALLLSCSLLLLGACGEDRPAVDEPDLSVEFPSGTVLIATETDTIPVQVEIAETDQQRRVGLMQRSTLGEEAGMIFLFETEQPPEGVFWMYNTLIPLSIAFIGEDGRIGSIRQMEPCTSPYPQWCPNYEAGVPYRAALEVNSGFFTSRGVEVGDRVVLQRE